MLITFYGRADKKDRVSSIGRYWRLLEVTGRFLDKSAALAPGCRNKIARAISGWCEIVAP